MIFLFVSVPTIVGLYLLASNKRNSRLISSNLGLACVVSGVNGLRSGSFWLNHRIKLISFFCSSMNVLISCSSGKFFSSKNVSMKSVMQSSTVDSKSSSSGKCMVMVFAKPVSVYTVVNSTLRSFNVFFAKITPTTCSFCT